MAQSETHQLTVLDKGIHCSGCEARIQGVLSRLAGVAKVKADYKTQRVSVTLTGEAASLQTVREKLEELGYRTAPQP